jgi:transposase
MNIRRKLIDKSTSCVYLIAICFIFVPVITTATAYQNHSREQLIEELLAVNTTVAKLQHELQQFKRLIFGSRHERFSPSATPEQLLLELNVNQAEQPEVTVQPVSYIRTVSKPSNKKEAGGRMKLPADLPREVIVIEPEEDVSGCKEIGREITEELEFTPGKFFVRQYIRPKYARAQAEEGQAGVVIGSLPARIIEKGIAGPGLLAQIMIDKYVDHLPLYRQIERFKRAGVTLPISTVTDWMSRASQELEVLYDVHRKLILGSTYLEGDETTIKVLDKDKKGKTHLGYYWVYRAPVENLVLFDYQEGRGREGPKELLKDFKGYLQTDGYDVYEYFDTIPGITQLCCMAHARRKFNEALDNDRSRAEYVLTHMQKLYALEREAKEANISFDQRYALRQEKAVDILKALEQWMKENYAAVLPQSPIGKAIAYSLKRWEKLCLYTTDGKLQIDNNLVENAIRPVAIGRKNYLFAGSHNAARRAAMIYSMLGTCKINNINPFDWLRDVFERIPSHTISKIEELLPHNWKSERCYTDSSEPSSPQAPKILS